MRTIERLAPWTVLLALAGLLGAAAPPPAFADAGGPVGGGRRWGGEPSPRLLLRAANLTPDQSARVKSIFSAHRTTVRGLVQQLRQAESDLRDQLNGSANVDSASLQPQLRRISTLRDQLLQDRAQMILEIRGVLTPDQLAHVQQVSDRLKAIRAEVRQLFPQAGQ